MSPMMRGQWAEALGPGLNLNTFRFRQFPMMYTLINKVRNSTRAWEDDFRTAGFGPLVQKSELGPSTLDEPLKIGGIRFVHKTFGLVFLISKELRDDSMYPEITEMARELGTSSYWTQELYGHDVYNNGFVTTKYVGRDGLALFATNHPVQGTGGTLGNRPAVDTDVSEAALEAAITAFDTQINERGMPIMVQPRTLLIHPSQKFLARRFLQSAGFPGGNNNDINPLVQEGLTDRADPWLTDQDAWFLLGAPDEVDVRFYWREQFDTATWDDQFARGTYHGGWQRHSNGFGDWRGTYGSPGA